MNKRLYTTLVLMIVAITAIGKGNNVRLLYWNIQNGMWTGNRMTTGVSLRG